VIERGYLVSVVPDVTCDVSYRLLSVEKSYPHYNYCKW